MRFDWSSCAVGLVAGIGIVLSAIVFSQLGRIGEFTCLQDENAVTCLRGWANVIAIVAGASTVVAAIMTIGQMRSDNVDQEERHRGLIDLELRKDRAALRRAKNGIVVPLRRAIGRTKSGVGSIMSKGFFAGRCEPDEALRLLRSEVRTTIDSRLFDQVSDLTKTDIGTIADQVRASLDGQMAPQSFLDRVAGGLIDRFHMEYSIDEVEMLKFIELQIERIAHAIEEARSEFELN